MILPSRHGWPFPSLLRMKFTSKWSQLDHPSFIGMPLGSHTLLLSLEGGLLETTAMANSANRLVVNRFVDDCDRDVEDCFLMRHSIDEEDYLLDIYNHSDREVLLKVSNLRPKQGFLLTYEVTSRPSFEWMRHVHQHILLINDEDKVPMILVGNKCDLEEDRQA